MDEDELEQLLKGFNPSQVGYKPRRASATERTELCFNPSQVGYKPCLFHFPCIGTRVSIPHR